MVEARPGEPERVANPLGRYGSTISGRYRLDEPQPSDLPGAERWSATDQILARSVTVTLLSSPRTSAVLDAARRAALVVDPRLTRILDVGSADGTGYVVTESPEGRSLASLAAHAPLTTDQARAVVGEAAAALEVARRRGVHHLALRPSILRVTPAGRVVLDGLAVDGELLDSAGAGAHAKSRSDTVGLVRVLYAALTGRWPVASAADGGPAVPTFDEWAASTDHGRNPAGDDTEHPAFDHGLPTAPEHDGAPLPPADLVPGVPADLDTLCVVTLGPHDDGPHSPGELVRELEPWGAVRADEIFRAADAGRWPALPDTSGTAGPSEQTPPRTTGNPADTTTAPSTGSSPMNDDLHGTTPAPDGGRSDDAVAPVQATPASEAGRGAAAGAAGGVAAGAVAAGAAGAVAGVAGAAADAGVKSAAGSGAGAAGAAGAGTATAGAGAAGNVARQSVRSAFSGAETAGTRRPGTPPPATPAPASFPPAAQAGAPTRTSVRPSSAGSTGTTPSGAAVTGTDSASARADSAAASPATDTTKAAIPPMTAPRSTPPAAGPDRTTVAGAAGAAAVAGATAASAGASAPAAPSPAPVSPAPGSPPPEPPAGTESGTAATSIFDPTTSATPRGTGGGAGTGPSRPDWDLPFPVERPAPSLAQRRFDPTRWVLGFVALAVVIGMVIALSNLLSPWQSSDDTANNAPAASPSVVASAPAAAADEDAEDEAPLTAPPVIASVSSIDPSDGDGEHEELVGRLVDGDPATSWYTHTYNRPDYAGFKDAIGLVVTLQAPATVTSITLTVNGSGGNVEVRSTDAANPTAGDVLVSGPLAPATVLTLAQPTETQSIVLWFTELAQTTDGANRIEISELTVS